MKISKSPIFRTSTGIDEKGGWSVGCVSFKTQVRTRGWGDDNDWNGFNGSGKRAGVYRGRVVGS